MANSRLCSISDCGKRVHGDGYCNAHYKRFQRHGDPQGGGTSPGEPHQYIRDVVVSYTGSDCLDWPYAKSANGYGQIMVGEKQHNTSRIVCTIAHGEPPTPEHEAAHSCGNGHLGCISPIHLSWKTATENHADRVEHGTSFRGEHNPIAKLTPDEVAHIRAMRGKIRQLDLAETYGVSQSLISLVQIGKSWSHI